MVNVPNVIDEWIKVLGYRQNYDPEGFQLSGNLIENESGMYYNDGHPLLTTENLVAIAPAFDKFTYPTWLIGTAYNEGNVVTLSNVNYIALRDNTGKTPASNPLDWEIWNGFNQWLLDTTRGSLTNALSEYLRENQIKEVGNNIFDRIAMYEGAANMTDTIENNSKVVGMELVLLKGKSVSMKIPKLSIQLDSNVTFNIKLFHSAKKAAIAIKEIAYIGAGDVQWFSLTDWLLYFDQNDLDTGGSYYIAYDQDDLGAAKAINKARDWGAAGCQCGRGEVRNFNLWSKAVKIHPFEADGTISTLWDIESNRYTYTLNYGLNLVFSAYCDYSNFLIEQKDGFKDFMQKRVTIDLLKEIVHNPNAKVVREMENVNVQRLEFEIIGDTKGRKTGIQYEYERSLKAVRLDMEGLDQACLKCEKRGIRMRSM